jgi:hypothetical protein
MPSGPILNRVATLIESHTLGMDDPQLPVDDNYGRRRRRLGNHRAAIRRAMRCDDHRTSTRRDRRCRQAISSRTRTMGKESPQHHHSGSFSWSEAVTYERSSRVSGNCPSPSARAAA